MNASTQGERLALQLVDIIELKWLLAREGIHLHVERLQCDPAYARQLLACAAGSPNPAVCAAAGRLAAQLERPAP
jgi:hypothetical protein